MDCILGVLKNLYVYVIVYFIGRLFNWCEFYDVDMFVVMDVVVEYNKVFELNVNFVWFDFNEIYCVMVWERGIFIVINLDVYEICGFLVFYCGVL